MEHFSKHSTNASYKPVDFCGEEKNFTGSLRAASSATTDKQQMVHSCLTPSNLRKLTACDDLQKVTFFETRVNTSTTSLGKFGALLPNLLQLKLNNSIISSVSTAKGQVAIELASSQMENIFQEWNSQV